MTLLERAAAAIALVNMRDIGGDVRLREITDTELSMIANAVIESIREPSDVMLKAARKGLGDYENAPENESWRDMITALLAEGE